MEEIRKNTDKENILLDIKFKFPLFIHITNILILLCLFTLTIFLTITTETDLTTKIYLWLISSIYLIVYIVLSIGIRFNRCYLTNKVIQGRKFILIGFRNFSFRLDMISNIETNNILGINGLKGGVTQGYISENNKKPFVLNFVDDYTNVIKILNNILKSVKNDKDVATSLSVKQTEALNNIASAINTKKNNETTAINTITSIKQLKELYDAKIITQEEYEKKKKDLLEKL